MNIKEIANKKDTILILILVLGYFFLRLTNLLVLPIFTDEAIYLRWSQIALHDSSWRFISLTDGKQPMLIWLTIVLMKFLKDPVLSGRLVSVIAGFFSLAGMFFLGWEIFRKKTAGYFSSLFYLFSPFFLWYDRLAVMDSLLSSFFVWATFFTILLVRRLRLDVSLILGMIIGGGVLTKTSAFFSIYLLPFYLLIFDFNKKIKSFFKLVTLSLISVLISLGFYNILRLSPWFHIVTEKDHSFIYTFSEIIESPFKHFFGNLQGLLGWWFVYFTVPYILLMLIGLFVKDKKYIRERILLFLIFILPFTALSFFGKVLYPRFILFMTLSLLPLCGYGLYSVLNPVKNQYYKIVIAAIIFAYPIYFTGQIVFDVINAPLPDSDRKQYLDDWPSGYGVKEVVNYLRAEKQKQPIFVATEGTFGLFPYALELEFFSDPKIKIQGYWPLPKPEVVSADSDGRPSYLLLKESQNVPSDWPVELIAQYRRGKGNTYLKFYKIIK